MAISFAFFMGHLALQLVAFMYLRLYEYFFGLGVSFESYIVDNLPAIERNLF